MSAIASGYRLSPPQRRLFRLRPGGEPALVRLEIEIAGAVDPARLARALAAVAERHEILRTGFRRFAGVALPLQIVREAPAIAWHTDGDREPCDPAAFDLAEGPLLRARLVRVEDDLHRLEIVLPALLCDAPGLPILARELARAYAAAPGAPEDEEIPAYTQVAELMNDLLEGEDSEAGRAFWSSQGLPALGEQPLPFGARGARDETSPRHRARRDLDAEVVERLMQALAPRVERPFELAVLTAWRTLLARLSGEASPIVGVEAAGRDLEVLAGSLGPLARYLPLALPLAAGEPFAQAVERTAAAWTEALAWQDAFAPEMLPAQRAGDAGEAVESGWSATFRALDLGGTLSAGDLQLRLVAAVGPADGSRLELALVTTADGARLELGAAPGWLRPAEVEDLLDRLATLLADAAADPRRPLGALPLLDREAHRRLLAEPNATARPGDGEPLFPDQLAARAAATPDQAAVAFGDEVLSFGELARRTGQLAHHLASLGVGPERVVGLLLERSPEAIVGLCAILAAGGVLLPLDLSLPEARLALMLREAGARVAISRGGLCGLLPAAVRVVDLDAEAAAIASQPAAWAPPPLDAENLAYVLYTSGSTGKPKAAMIRHHGLVHLGAALEQAFYAELGVTRVSVNAPLVFDASVKQWIQLARGRCLDLVPEEIRPDGTQLLAHLERRAVEVLDCTPTQLRGLVAAGLIGTGSYPRAALIGGEAVAPDLWAALAADSRRRYLNVYGPTETTVDATAAPILPATVPTIGGPLANVQVHLLDAAWNLVPAGAAGEIGIGGDGLARGYLGRPGLTAERFVPDPGAGITSPAGARLYRSGDRARRRLGGDLEFLGRRDHQVKVRGFRIELGEIEAELTAQPRVAAAAVTVHRGEGGGEHLVAYVVPAGGSAPGDLAAELRAALRQQLPEPMVPAHFVLLRELPTNRSGKVDRLALPDPGVALAASEAPYLEPRNEIERQVAAIWQRTLGVERVGVDDNFFDLGGHSLLMVRVYDELRAAFDTEMTMLEMFRYPTVGALAEHLGRPPAGAVEAPAAAEAPGSDARERARLQAQAAERQRQAAARRRQGGEQTKEIPS